MHILPKPKSWSELTRQLRRGERDPLVGRVRPIIAFRGLSERKYRLETGIQRLYKRQMKNRRISGHPSVFDPLWIERRLIDTFKMYAIEHLPTEISDWDVLQLAQHYRLPTRLLDWSSSPFVALFFATENTDKWNKDGIIWCVNRIKTNKLLPVKYKTLFQKHKTTILTIDLLKTEFPSGIDEFDAQTTKPLFWFEPPSISARIVNQYAFFSIMPGVKTSQTDFLESQPKLVWGVLVPKELKPEIHDRLAVMNISHRIIYPGLEGISKWLGSYYGP